MLQKPKLKTFLTVYPLEEHLWGIRGGDGDSFSLRLTDPAAIRCFGILLPLLDGSTSRRAILEQVAALGIDVTVAERLLDRLDREGLLEETADAGLTSEQQKRFRMQINLFSRFGNEGGAKLQARLLGSRVAVVGSSGLAKAVCHSLTATGFGRVTSIQGAAEQFPIDDVAGSLLPLDRKTVLPAEALASLPDLIVAALDVHDPEVLESMHVFSQTHGIPWLLVRAMNQIEGWVGPLFVPQETASYVSFESRLRGNMQHYERYVEFDTYARENPAGIARPGGFHALCHVLAGIAATESAKLVTGVAVPALAGKFLSLNIWTLDTEIHEVLRFPRLEMESYSRPTVFPWKEMPSSGQQTRRS